MAAAKKAGIELDEAQLAQVHAQDKARLEEQSTASYASSLLWDDGIIEPTETRQTLTLALSVASAAEEKASDFGVFRM